MEATQYLRAENYQDPMVALTANVMQACLPPWAPYNAPLTALTGRH